MIGRRRPLALPALLTLLAAGCGGGGDRVPAGTPASSPAGGTPAAPVVVALDPPDGATQVDPTRTTLSVTFDREMDRQGWSWVQESPETTPELVGEPWFDDAGRTNTAGVRLEPGRTYVVWINHGEYDFFRDLHGNPATPFRWTFTTAGSRIARTLSLPAADPPRVVALEPPDGARGVAPGDTALRVTFDRPMGEGWSWVQEDPRSFPRTLGEPVFEEDRRTQTLAVRLEPETTYVIWLNSPDFQMFRSEEGVALEPVRWSFTTGPGSQGGPAG